MATLDEIKQMQKEGKSEEEISAALAAKGVSEQEIANAMAQAKIKDAVSQPPSEPQQEAPKEAAPPTPSPDAPAPAGQPPKGPATRQEGTPTEGMAPSMMGSEGQGPATSSPDAPAPPGQPPAQEPEDILPDSLTSPKPAEPAPSQPAAAPAKDEIYPPQQQTYPPADQQTYQQDVGAALSSDTISEISEQVVAEKLSAVTNELEKVLELKSTIDSRVESLDERLKRIEGIINTLQTSVLQKVGDYVTNVQDMKTELAETQKSFKSLLPKTEKKTSP